jgi:glycosyltransferase involved in cell wall biosynthesis
MRESAVAEQVADGVNGLLAASDDDLVRYVQRLVEDPASRASMAEANRMGAVENDWPVVIERHLEVYAGAREKTDPSLRSG